MSDEKRTSGTYVWWGDMPAPQKTSLPDWMPAAPTKRPTIAVPIDSGPPESPPGELFGSGGTGAASKK